MNFLFFSTIFWDWVGGTHQSPQLAREIARRGHRVLFVQPGRPSNVERLDSSIRVVSLPELGLAENLTARAWHGLKVEPLESVATNLLAELERMEQSGEPCVAVWFAPFDPFARLLPLLRAQGCRLIYYPQDDYEDMIRLGYYHLNAPAEEYLGHECETIVTISRPVAEKLKRFGRSTSVVPNGINLDDFHAAQAAAAPPGILCGERTLGFWGWIGSAMVDAQALAYIAQARPNWAINLLGGVETQLDHPTIPERLKDYANVRFHGEIAHECLKDYGPYFDVCLIPGPDNDFSRGRDPLKVYEYLALHKPVVSTHMPQLAGMPYVRNASTPPEFLNQIEIALQTPVEPQVVEAFLAQQTWSARAEAFLSVVGNLVENTHLFASPDLTAGELIAPSFAQGSPGLLAYLEAVETDLAQTRQWAKELETLVQVKDQELQRIYNFLPVRWARSLRRALGRR